MNASEAEEETARKSRAPQLIEDQLTDCLKLFCESQGLRLLSADELLFEDLTDTQRAWVSSFCDLWEANDQYTK
jgi:hypothetical protein